MNYLGKQYRDRVTGFEGTATGFVQYLTGCNQLLLAPPVNTDGSMKDSHWFDVQRLVELLDKEQIVLDNGPTPGCDRAAPKR